MPSTASSRASCCKAGTSCRNVHLCAPVGPSHAYTRARASVFPCLPPLLFHVSAFVWMYLHVAACARVCPQGGTGRMSIYGSILADEDFTVKHIGPACSQWHAPCCMHIRQVCTFEHTSPLWRLCCTQQLTSFELLRRGHTRACVHFYACHIVRVYQAGMPCGVHPAIQACTAVCCMCMSESSSKVTLLLAPTLKQGADSAKYLQKYL